MLVEVVAQRVLLLHPVFDAHQRGCGGRRLGSHLDGTRILQGVAIPDNGTIADDGPQVLNHFAGSLVTRLRVDLHQAGDNRHHRRGQRGIDLTQRANVAIPAGLLAFGDVSCGRIGGDARQQFVEHGTQKVQVAARVVVGGIRAAFQCDILDGTVDLFLHPQ